MPYGFTGRVKAEKEMYAEAGYSITNPLTGPMNQLISVSAKTYAITFDSNKPEKADTEKYDFDLTGTMAPQTVSFYQDVPLIPNAYKITTIYSTNEAYTFKGWSKTKGGPVEFEDKETINNICDPDKSSIILYAVCATVAAVAFAPSFM